MDSNSAFRDSSYTAERLDILELVPEKAMTILDIGCSNGTLGKNIRKVDQGRKVTGVEIDPVFYIEAKHHLNEVICDDFNKFNWVDRFGNSKFDGVVKSQK